MLTAPGSSKILGAQAPPVHFSNSGLGHQAVNDSGWVNPDRPGQHFQDGACQLCHRDRDTAGTRLGCAGEASALL